jgi:chitinase
VIGDRIGEQNETFVVNLSGATNASIVDSQGVGTIVDDEPRLSIGDATVIEGNIGTRAATFTVTLSAASSEPVTVAVTTNETAVTVGSPPTSGLVSLWHAEGNAFDAFGSNPGTLTNGTTFASGKTGQAFSLDGTDDYVSVPSNASLDPTAAATLSAWIYLDTLPSAAGHIMSIMAKGGPGRDLDFQVETDNRVRFYVATGAPNVVASTTVLQAGQWYHVAATYTAASNVKMYINGVLEATTSISATRLTNTNPFTIGENAQWTGRYFDGLIDEPALHNVALSAAEIATYATTATAGSDYQAASGTLTIPAGQTTGTITVSVIGDRIGEQNETFVVNLSGATNASIVDSQGVGTIVDDEPRLSINNMSIKEGNSGTKVMTFNVTLSAAYDQPVTVHYATQDSSATVADNDYVATSGTLAFAAGQTSQTISVVIKGDRKTETDEYFNVVLSSVSSNALIDNAYGWCTILDDDGPKGRR